MEKNTRPEYYRNNGKDLISIFNEDIFTPEESKGFMKGNIIKYVVRCENKNGIEDLDKAAEYIKRYKEILIKEKEEIQKEQEVINAFVCQGEKAKGGSVDRHKPLYAKEETKEKTFEDKYNDYLLSFFPESLYKYLKGGQE